MEKTDVTFGQEPVPIGPRLVCRRCRMEASYALLYALLDETAHGCARCFCGSIEWDQR